MCAKMIRKIWQIAAINQKSEPRSISISLSNTIETDDSDLAFSTSFPA